MKNKAHLLKALSLLAAATVISAAAPCAAFAAEILSLPVERAVEEGDNYVIKGVTYETTDPSDAPTDHFETRTQLNGKTLTVIEVTEPVIVSEKAVSPKDFHYTSPFFSGNPENHMPDEATVIEDTNVILRRKVQKAATAEERTRHVFQDVTFTALEEGYEIPKKQDIEFTDTDSEQKVIASMNLVSSVETACYWSDEFSFPIKVTGYDAETFLLDDTEIGREEDLNGYKSQFLEYLGLSSDWYEITDISWNGGPYEAGGEICRNAIAIGNKKVKDFSATYEGDVTLPQIDGFIWECEYEEVIPEGREYIYTMSTDVTLCKNSTSEEGNWLKDLWNFIKKLIMMLFEFLIETIKKHPVESVLVLSVFSLGIAFLLFKASRRTVTFTVLKEGSPIRENPSDSAREVAYRLMGDELTYAGKKENGYTKVYTDSEKLSSGWIKNTDIKESRR